MTDLDGVDEDFHEGANIVRDPDVQVLSVVIKVGPHRERPGLQGGALSNVHVGLTVRGRPRIQAWATTMIFVWEYLWPIYCTQSSRYVVYKQIKVSKYGW